MSSWGKISLLTGGFFLVLLAGTRYILGAWIPVFYVFLTLILLSLVINIVLDYKFYFEFFSMKTTKSGLSLGTSFILFIILLIAIGFLGNRFDKTYDFTEEGINSLSHQTQESLKGLKQEVFVRIFYKGDKISSTGQVQKDELRNAFDLYKQFSSNFKVRWIDSYSENIMAEKYLSNLHDKNQKEIFVFMEYGDKRIRIEPPYTEETITSALIKVQKRVLKEIYFLTGHGERDLNIEQPLGLSLFRKHLEDSGFILKEWSFIQDKKPQEPPALILIIGPRRPFLAEELNWLKDYLKNDGKVFMALDPGENHNLKSFLNQYGIDYKNNFIVSQFGAIYGSATKALGINFDSASSITKNFQVGKDIAFFDVASVVSASSKSKDNLSVSVLLRSLNKSFVVPKLKKELTVGTLNSFPMVVEAKRKQATDKQDSKKHEGHDHSEHAHDKPKSTESDESEVLSGFRLIVSGDSDFLINQNIYQGVNRDFVLNIIMSLVDENELISIRPKQPAGTKITLNRIHRLILVITMITLPFIFVIMSMWFWYRRREA